MIPNKEQKKVINETDGLISVVAGPGSGKTKTLIERAKYLLQKQLCSQNEILLITFTNKVRHEIIERVEQEIGENNLQIHTFHSYAIEVVKKYSSIIGLKGKLKIIEESDIKVLLEEAYFYISSKNRNFVQNFDFDEIIEQGYYKDVNKCKNVNEKTLIKEFIKLKKLHNYATYDDLIEYLLKILKTTASIDISNKIKYLMVDECQDLNDEQYEIITLFEKNNVKNILLVGDIDQSIYAWRGANPDLFTNWRKNSKQLHLITNYRSKKDIIDCSQKLIKNNASRISLDYNVKKTGTGSVVINHFETKLNQAEDIVKFISDNKLHTKKSIAILFRANYLSHDFINYLYQYNIPFNNYNEVEFYSKKEIRDIVCFLRLINDKNDLIAWRYILENSNCLIKEDYINLHNFKGEDIYDKLANFLNINNLNEINQKIFFKLFNSVEYVIGENNLSLIDKIVYLLKTNDYKKRVWKNHQDTLENVQLFLAEIEDVYNLGITLEDFLINLGMGDHNSNEKELSHSNIDLLTIHSSKGLEYDHVFVVDVNHDVLPHKRNDNLEEERRLLYVAITRAKEKLNISYISNGKSRASIFIQEII